MQFKTKDLLVTVLPKAEISAADLAKYCLLRTVICRHPTLCANFTCALGTQNCGFCSWLSPCLCSLNFSRGGCGFAHSCGPGNSACDPTIFCPGGSRDPFVIESLDDLTTLKTELQATLKSLDSIQKEGLPVSIASKKDAEALERSLTEALDQVRAAKKNL
jgi:hypothetical protein